MLYDTHAHVNENAFDEDRADVLARIHANGVSLYNEVERIWRTAGVPLRWHSATIGFTRQRAFIPEAKHAPADYLTQLEELLLAQPRCVALGEIGLDYHYDFSPRDVQRRILMNSLRWRWLCINQSLFMTVKRIRIP